MRWLILLPLAATTAMPFADVLGRYGLFAVFLFVTVENFGLPIPGETMLVVASAYAAGGHLNIFLVVPCCIAGVWLGSTLSYLAGRSGGVALMRRLHVPERHLARAQTYIERWGSHTVFFGRYVAFLRSYIGWLAGLNKMQPGPFLFWNLAGATAWTLTFAPLGYLLGHNWAVIETIFRDIGYGGVALVVLGVVGFVLYRRRRERLADARADVAAELAAQPSASPQEAPETTLVGGDSPR